MGLIIATVLVGILGLIAVCLCIKEKKKYELPEDDGIVWNTRISKRMEEEKRNGRKTV